MRMQGPPFLKTKHGPPSTLLLASGNFTLTWKIIKKATDAKFFLHFSSDMSDSSLKYLNSEQALADLATFCQEMALKFNLTNSKWISFGGSYPGSLSAWYRLKYPHLVQGG